MKFFLAIALVQPNATASRDRRMGKADAAGHSRPTLT